MIWLGDVARGRDNNFNLIRFVAATAVLVSHAWPIALGDGVAEPLHASTGHSLGGLAVFVFFAVSGFFITASFARTKSARIFVKARVLRLVPCLAVSLLLVALVMGPLVTTLPMAEYLSHSETAKFLFRNITLISPKYTLPGVFETNPYPTVEGSIWTLIHEVLCYGLVFLAGITGVLGRPRLMFVAMLAYAVVWVLPEVTDLQMPARFVQTRLLSLPFVIGMAFWQWRDRLPLSLIGVAGVIALAVLTKGMAAGFPLLMLAIAYTTFWLAYVPKGPLRAFNRFGDYSYGIYVYAFPLQGLAVWLFGPMQPWVNIAIALPMTLICAVLSWHLIERPALALAHAGEKAAA